MWDAPDFRAPFDLNFIPTFDHVHPIITKLTWAFLTLYQYAKKPAHFINSLSWYMADFRVQWSKRPLLFLTTATQNQVTTNMTGTQ